MRASRLLSELMLLQAHGRLCTREVAERMEISQRTAHRDMEALCAAGVPLVALRGATGGWELDGAWRTQVPALDEKELQALFMAQLSSSGGESLALSTERALTKVVAALPTALRARVALIRERFYVDPEGWGPWTEDPTALPVVQEAVVNDRKLAFRYNESDRVAEPLGLVCKQTVWYLVARTTSGLRTFRVSRMSGATVLEESFDRPPAFDLAAYWKGTTAELQTRRQQYRAVLAMPSQTLQEVTRRTEVDVLDGVPPQGVPAGWVMVSIGFEGEAQALFVALGLGSQAVVLKPEALREQVVRQNQEVRTRYIP